MIDANDIRRMLLGHFTMPEDSSLPGQKIVVCAYVIHHEDGPILFDTGIGEHEEADRVYHPVRRDLRAALAGAGVRLEDVRAVANCHLHVDHAGGNPHFPGRPIFVQRAETDAASDQEYTNPNVIDFDGVTLEVHDGDADLAPGVRILPTPGHTPGHQSLLVQTRQGRIVLAGQAFNDASGYARAAFASHLAERGEPGVSGVPDWVATLQQQVDPVRVLFAHDLASWERPVDVLSP